MIVSSCYHPRIAHIITDLNGFGGTEATLLKYLKESKFHKDSHRIIVLKSSGVGDTIGAQMVSAGFSVVELNQRKGNISLQGITKLYRELEAFSPDVISAWLYHPSLLATVLSAFLQRRSCVIWHIRSLPFATFLRTPNRYIVLRILSLFSIIAKPLVVSNSTEAIRMHILQGFKIPAKLQRVIPNGVDLAQYYPDSAEGLTVRKELGIPFDAVVIGCVGRFVPEKGYQDFFEAIKLVRKTLAEDQFRRIHFLGVGSEVSLGTPSFSEISTSAFSQHQLHLLGKRPDVPRLLRALDIFVLPSISEAFPNSLIEAMATGVACVTTNVGQCGEVLGNSKYVVPPSDPNQIANRIVKLIDSGVDGRSKLGQENRMRVADKYELSKMVRNFDELFSSVAVS